MVATAPFPIRSAGLGGPGSTRTDKRQTLVASGWQALPLDYRRGIILPFPALPLRVAPEHPGKPPRVSTALGRRREGQRRGDAAQCGGPRRAPRALGQTEGPSVCLALSSAQLPAGPGAARCSARTQHALPGQGPGPWPAPTYLGVGEFPQDHHHALRLKAVLPALTRCWSCSGNGSVREKTQEQRPLRPLTPRG